MMTKSPYFRGIRDYLDEIPIIETHEHHRGQIEPVFDILSFIVDNYYQSDLISSFIRANEAFITLSDCRLPFEERYPLFEALFEKSCHTAYAKAMRTGLSACWGIDQLNAASLHELEERFKQRDQAFFDSIMQKNKIKAFIADVDLFSLISHPDQGWSELCRFAFPLPDYHHIRKAEDIHRFETQFGNRITSLDDYLLGFEQYLKRCIDFGIVCIKDQTAYRRIIHYEKPSRSDAEKIFSYLLTHPRDLIGEEQARILDDWLFHYFICLAAKYELPVQIHTGHLAGIRNDIVKANAVHLTSVLELYSQVPFDLFHGNWPYMGELLFLGKNYPNVTLDLCWVHAIDPLYAVELMKRALVTIPHQKIMAFGGDTTQPEWSIGYLIQAKDNVAVALSDMIDCGWIGVSDARLIAKDWFFNNPNHLFKLCLQPA